MRARDDIAGERIFIRDKQCKQLGAMGNKQKAKGKGQKAKGKKQFANHHELRNS